MPVPANAKEQLGIPASNLEFTFAPQPGEKFRKWLLCAITTIIFIIMGLIKNIFSIFQMQISIRQQWPKCYP